ncbi:hypothetical protein ACQEUU_18390 [Nonomuraea sp. CA-218870]|uniref:hypothetical protein n=1 Tax=Nonomuraea sp. CA-218870 TaxID=3239998 RepID=UPI003D91B391
MHWWTQLKDGTAQIWAAPSTAGRPGFSAAEHGTGLHLLAWPWIGTPGPYGQVEGPPSA